MLYWALLQLPDTYKPGEMMATYGGTVMDGMLLLWRAAPALVEEAHACGLLGLLEGFLGGWHRWQHDDAVLLVGLSLLALRHSWAPLLCQSAAPALKGKAPAGSIGCGICAASML